MDEEYARWVCDREDAGEEAPPTEYDEDEISPLGYSDTIGRLDLIADRLMAVRTAVQAGYAADHQEPKIHLLPKPKTAIEKERERRTVNELESVDRLFRGGLELVIYEE